MRVAVFLTPAGDDFCLTDGIIREFSARFDSPLFEPHLTVCSGICADTEFLKDLAAGAAQALPPLTLRVKRVACSATYFRTLYIEFEPDPLLSALRERVSFAVERSDADAFLPHLSLLYQEMPLAEKEAAARSLLLDRSEFTFDSLKIVTPANVHEGWRTLGWETLFLVPLVKGEAGRPAVQ